MQAYQIGPTHWTLPLFQALDSPMHRQFTSESESCYLYQSQWRIPKLTVGGGGAHFSARIYKHFIWHCQPSYALEGSVIFQSKYAHVFVFGNLNGEDLEPAAPLGGFATESLNKYMQVLHAMVFYQSLLVFKIYSVIIYF